MSMHAQYARSHSSPSLHVQKGLGRSTGPKADFYFSASPSSQSNQGSMEEWLPTGLGWDWGWQEPETSYCPQSKEVLKDNVDRSGHRSQSEEAPWPHQGQNQHHREWGVSHSHRLNTTKSAWMLTQMNKYLPTKYFSVKKERSLAGTLTQDQSEHTSNNTDESHESPDRLLHWPLWNRAQWQTVVKGKPRHCSGTLRTVTMK